MMALMILVKLLFALAAVPALCESEFNPTIRDNQSDTSNWTVNFLEKLGYKVEHHEVTTEDGYILTLQRIPRPNGGGRPVLLHHGFLGRSADFVVLGNVSSLGLILANKGYDVWMANSRGSTDSKRHRTLKTTDEDFWDFSWHEIGYYDIPSEIDYILKQTGNKNLSFVGYSMGASAFFVTMSTRPEYNRKVDKMVALAPATFMEYVHGPLLKYVAPLATRAPWVFSIFGKGEFLPTNKLMIWAAKKFCADDTNTQKLCGNILFLLFGHDTPNWAVFENVFEYAPSGGSTKEFLHFAQLIRTAPSFQMFDYGFFKNLFKYGQPSPPDYKLNLVSTPVYLFVSENDWFAERADIMTLGMKLPNVQGLSFIKRKNFSHIDFVYASDAKELCYNNILEVLES